MTREDEAALAAYRVVNPEGPAYSTLSDDDRAKWREAFGVARRIEPVVVVCSPPMELTESSFAYARNQLGGTPAHMATIYASPIHGEILRRLRDKYGCQFVELPQSALVTRWTWLLGTGDGWFWSAPSD